MAVAARLVQIGTRVVTRLLLRVGQGRVRLINVLELGLGLVTLVLVRRLALVLSPTKVFTLVQAKDSSLIPGW